MIFNLLGGGKETGNSKASFYKVHIPISCLCFYLFWTWQLGEEAQSPKFGKDLKDYVIQLSHSTYEKMEEAQGK